MKIVSFASPGLFAQFAVALSSGRLELGFGFARPNLTGRNLFLKCKIETQKSDKLEQKHVPFPVVVIIRCKSPLGRQFLIKKTVEQRKMLFTYIFR